MPHARPLPRKFMGILEEVQEDLRAMAQRARMALSEIEADERPFELSRVILRDTEALCYRIALDISQMHVAGNCDSCPSAPPSTESQAVLYVIADELERQAIFAREHAVGGESPWPLLLDGE